VTSLTICTEAKGDWCPSRSSKPVRRLIPVGGFDSRPPPRIEDDRTRRRLTALLCGFDARPPPRIEDDRTRRRLTALLCGFDARPPPRIEDDRTRRRLTALLCGFDSRPPPLRNAVLTWGFSAKPQAVEHAPIDERNRLGRSNRTSVACNRDDRDCSRTAQVFRRALRVQRTSLRRRPPAVWRRRVLRAVRRSAPEPRAPPHGRPRAHSRSTIRRDDLRPRLSTCHYAGRGCGRTEAVSGAVSSITTWSRRSPDALRFLTAPSPSLTF
jgi:hypothetical protein